MCERDATARGCPGILTLRTAVSQCSQINVEVGHCCRRVKRHAGDYAAHLRLSLIMQSRIASRFEVLSAPQADPACQLFATGYLYGLS